MPARFKKIFIVFLLVVLPLSGVWQTGWGAWIHIKAFIAQTLLETAWTDTLNGQKEVKPWPWADTWPVSRLTVPRLGISRIVLAGASGESLAFGPGLLFNTAGSGQPGNTVIAGHRDTHFRFLRYLQKNDLLLLQTANNITQSYRVVETVITSKTQTGYIEETDEDVLTLITCYPFDAVIPGGPLRYIVIAKRLQPPTTI